MSKIEPCARLAFGKPARALLKWFTTPPWNTDGAAANATLAAANKASKRSPNPRIHHPSSKLDLLTRAPSGEWPLQDVAPTTALRNSAAGTVTNFTNWVVGRAWVPGPGAIEWIEGFAF